MNARQSFDRAYQRTVTASGASLDRDHADECWTQVEAFAASVFDVAATRLNGASVFLPRPSEWLATCRAVQGEQDMVGLRRREVVAEGYQRERTYHCPVCRDSGLEQGLHCVKGALCGSCRGHAQHLYDHTYCRPCACYQTNPVIQSRLDERRAEAAERKGGTRRAA